MKAFRVLAFAPLLLGSGLAIGAERGMPDDVGGVPDKKEFKEDEVKLPAPPMDSELIEFRPRGASKNRFYIDGKSVSLGADWVVRYTAVVKSPSGVSNVSYEGLRCKTSEYKVYAYGRKSGEWASARDLKWQGVSDSALNFRYSLYKDYLCEIEAVAGFSSQELVAKLKGNPLINFDSKQR